MVSEFFKSLFKMKLLFIANRIPYPPHRGDKLKIFNLATRLRECGHELHLISICEKREELKYNQDLKKIFHESTLILVPPLKSYLQVLLAFFQKMPFQVAYFQSRRLKKLLNRTLNTHTFDAVHIQHLRMLPYGLRINIPKILDLPDAYSMYWKRKVEQEKRPIQKKIKEIEYYKVLQYEKKLIEFDKVLVCSREDQQYLIDTHELNNVEILPNGVDIRTFKKEVDVSVEHKLVLFTGNMNYAPNVDAVKYFVRDIFPLILSKHPDARFLIAGQNPTKQVQELAGSNIIITGFVENMALQYQQASLVVAPLRIGAGTQNKVLEAMAMEKPVVCTHIGFEGLGVKSGQGVILAHNAKDFADWVNRLLDDENMANDVSLFGKKHVLKYFDWDVISKTLEIYFENIINHQNHNARMV